MLGRVVTIVLLAIVAAWAFGLLFVSVASVMTAGACGSAEPEPTACVARGTVALFTPWIGWLLGLVGGILGTVLHWRRRAVWVWGPFGVVMSALGLLSALVLLFGWTFWS